MNTQNSWNPVTMLRNYWEYVVMGLTLATLALFLAGHNLFGLSGLVASLLAILGALMAAIISFFVVTLVVPLVALITGFIAAVVAAFMGLAAILIGGLFTPLAVLVTGWLSAIVGWLAGTWLGTLLAPLYNVLAPIVIKVAPWITTGKYATKAWDWLEKNRPQLFVAFSFSAEKKPPRQPQDAASQSAARGRSSVRAKPRHAPKPRQK